MHSLKEMPFVVDKFESILKSELYIFKNNIGSCELHSTFSSENADDKEVDIGHQRPDDGTVGVNNLLILFMGLL